MNTTTELPGDGLDMWARRVASIVLALGLLTLLGLLANLVAHNVGWLVTAGAVRTVTEPVHTFLTAHAGQLPISGQALAHTWAAVSLLLWGLAVTGLRPARLGWIATGAATAAMVFLATPQPAAPVAVGVTAAWWVLLSLPALAGQGRDHTVIYPPQPPTSDAPEDRHSTGV